MNRNDCEAVLHLHRIYLPRRRTGRGFLTGTVFLDAALLIVAFVLATSPFVLKSGITLNLPVASQTGGMRVNNRILTVSREGLLFFNDEQVTLDSLETALRAGAGPRSESTLILQADQAMSQSVVTAIYDAAARAGFKTIFIATRNTPASSP